MPLDKQITWIPFSLYFETSSILQVGGSLACYIAFVKCA